MNKRIFICVLLLCIAGCRTATDPLLDPSGKVFSGEKYPVVAILPVHNMSGTKAPLNEIRQILKKDLNESGIPTLDEDIVKQFIVKHRIRYLGGLDRITGKYFKDETGVHTVLQTSLELYRDALSPQIALMARLIRVGENGSDTLWMESVSLSGDDSPGLLGLSLITDQQTLLHKTLETLVHSLKSQLSGEEKQMFGRDRPMRFQPKVLYGSADFLPEKKYRVAVAPFYNSSERKYAGDIMALHFVNHLLPYDTITVVEPGDVRDAFLKWRIIMDDGISLSNANVLFRKLNVDLILTGNVFDYEDAQGSAGHPKVHFSAFLFEKNTTEVIWASTSFNQGDDGVFLFGLGDVKTAHALASQMTAQATSTIFSSVLKPEK